MSVTEPNSFKQDNPVYYMGLIGNVDSTILNLEMGGDFKIEKRIKSDIIKLLSELFCHSELDVDCDIQDKYQYDEEDQYVYIVSKEYHYWYFDAPKDAPVEEVVKLHQGMDYHDDFIK